MKKLSSRLPWKIRSKTGLGGYGHSNEVVIITNDTYEPSPTNTGVGIHSAASSPSISSSVGELSAAMSDVGASDAGTTSTSFSHNSPSTDYGLGLSTYNVFGSFLGEVLLADEAYKPEAMSVYEDALKLGVCSEQELDKMPLIVLNCLNYLYSYGIATEAVLRLSSSVIVSQTLKYRFIYGGPCIGLSPKEVDAHTVVSVLKEFLRSLTDFSEPLDSGFVMSPIQDVHSDEDPIMTAQGNLRQLSNLKYILLKSLCRFFNRVASLHTVNKMTAYNIAVTIAPTLNVSLETLKVLIDQYEYVWSDFSDIRIDTNASVERTSTNQSKKNDSRGRSHKSSQAPLDHYNLLFPDEQKYRPGYYKMIDDLVGQKLTDSHSP